MDAPRPPARTARQQATVDVLLDAALAHLRSHGDDGLTVRAVATRAGVTHTTAYAYFSSRDHLVAEAYRRRVREVPVAAPDLDRPLGQRVRAAVAGPGLAAADDPALARAALTALLSEEPAVAEIRDALGRDVAARLEAAVGPGADPELVEALAIAFSGAMLQAGMGYFPFSGVVDRLGAIADRLDPCPRR